MDVPQLLDLALLLASATLGGRLARGAGFPPLVGMLAAGLLLRNVPGGLLDDLPDDWSSALRLVALTVILLRAGLGLDLATLRRLRATVARLAVLPNLAEAATVAAAASLLFDFPVAWALLLGFVVSAVSPAVVVPSLLDLQIRGFGTRKGIPTMVLAAASIDDVLSIAGFGLATSMIFGAQGETSVGASLLRAPLELILGLSLGAVLGFACGLLRAAPGWLRFAALAISGLSGVLGGWAISMTGGGSLAAIAMAAIAADRWGTEKAAVASAMNRVWSVAQPALFGLIGATVLLAVIEPAHVALGLVILAVGLVARIGITLLVVDRGQFSTLERLFVAIAWLPKATVQAAIGALALDLARSQDAGPDAILFGTQVLTVAVLAIIITAPLGAIAIAKTGPRWLDHDPGREP